MKNKPGFVGCTSIEEHSCERLKLYGILVKKIRIHIAGETYLWSLVKYGDDTTIIIPLVMGIDFCPFCGKQLTQNSADRDSRVSQLN